MKYPDIAALARAALEGSGCKTRTEFQEIYGCSPRTLAGWMTGERMPDGVGLMVLRQAAKGWRPQ